MRKIFGIILLLLIICLGTAGADVRITGVPETGMAGEVIDFRVETDAPGVTVLYALARNGEDVYRAKKEDTHFQASFRPRSEGEYTLTATVGYADGTTETGTAALSVRGTAEEPAQGPENVYSQKDGWWKDKEYRKSDLDNAGCAIFALSHALQRMGWTGEDIRPENLAVTYKKCYTKNGTANARLIYEASQVYGYTTKSPLIKEAGDLRDGLRNGDLYSFGIVIGHIALMTGIDENAKMVRIVDSAPSATFERIKKGKIYIRQDGEYKEISDPGELPGARYYFETGYYGGAEYYMDLSYCARRGGRLIRPSWLFYLGSEGKIGAGAVEIGIGESRISINGKEQTVATRELQWGSAGQPKLAVVTEKKNIKMVNADGKRIGTIAPCRVLPVLAEEDGRVYIIDGETRGYLKTESIEIAEPAAGEILKGQISVNGNTSGRAKVKMRFGPSEKQKVIDNWRTGTEVTLLAKSGEFWQVEGRGMRLWVHQDYLTADAAAEAFFTETNTDGSGAEDTAEAAGQEENNGEDGEDNPDGTEIDAGE
ncbi:MAG: hypothetical protein IKE25_08865 [Clostridia bacterium]|nr:hypothetical protein [Clostridia bacterium]